MPVTTAARRRARRGEGALLREEILTAAEELLIRTENENAVSIRAVADAVGVTPPSIYLHFADKEALLYEVCQRHFAHLDEVLEAGAAGASDPLESLRLRGHAYVRFGLDHPEHYRIMFMQPPMGVTAHADRVLEDDGAFRHLVGAVERCQQAGVVRAGDPVLMSFAVWATVHGITSLLVAKPGIPLPVADVDSLIDAVLSQHLNGLLAHPAG